MKKLKVILFAACAALAAGATYADPAGTETVSIVVHFEDLNLNSPAGVARLHTRIRNAARKVCSQSDPGNLRTEWRTRACISQSVSRAITQVNLPALTRNAAL